MSVALTVLIVALGVAVIGVRRRSLAIALVSAQSITLSVGAFALASGRSEAFLVAAILLAVKAAAIPVLLVAVVARTREPQLLSASTTALARLVGALALCVAAAVLVPPLGLAPEHVEDGAVALLLVGIAIAAARRPAMFQLLGILVAETGLSMLAVAAHGGVPFAIELGAIVDLALVATVAAAFTHRIHGELGSSDTELLRVLRD